MALLYWLRFLDMRRGFAAVTYQHLAQTRRNMNKPSKIALALAIAAASASGAVSAQTVDNWRNPFGNVWMNGTNELCWRNNFWTPATGVPGCDGVPVAEAPVVAPTANKVVLNADTFFDFDKDTLKPEGRQDRKSTRLNSSHVKISYAVF